MKTRQVTFGVNKKGQNIAQYNNGFGLVVRVQQGSQGCWSIAYNADAFPAKAKMVTVTHHAEGDFVAAKRLGESGWWFQTKDK